MQCPICAYEDDSEDALTLHIEELHFKQRQALSTPKQTTHGYSQSELDSALAHQLQQGDRKDVDFGQGPLRSVAHLTEHRAGAADASSFQWQ